jgi:hypothetical protein
MLSRRMFALQKGQAFFFLKWPCLIMGKNAKNNLLLMQSNTLKVHAPNKCPPFFLKLVLIFGTPYCSSSKTLLISMSTNQDCHHMQRRFPRLINHSDAWIGIW